jgi:hypothetical protein
VTGSAKREDFGSEGDFIKADRGTDTLRRRLEGAKKANVHEEIPLCEKNNQTRETINCSEVK